MSSASGVPEAFTAAWRPSSRYTDVRWPTYHNPLAGLIRRGLVNHTGPRCTTMRRAAARAQAVPGCSGSGGRGYRCAGARKPDLTIPSASS